MVFPQLNMARPKRGIKGEQERTTYSKGVLLRAVYEQHAECDRGRAAGLHTKGEKIAILQLAAANTVTDIEGWGGEGGRDLPCSRGVEQQDTSSSEIMTGCTDTSISLPKLPLDSPAIISARETVTSPFITRRNSCPPDFSTLLSLITKLH